MAFDEESLKRGEQTLAEIFGPPGVKVIENLQDISPDMGKYVYSFIMDLYERPGLDKKAREFGTVAALLTLGTIPQLKVHLHAALNLGWSRQEVVELILHLSAYVGFPLTLNAISAAKEVFQERDEQGLNP